MGVHVLRRYLLTAWATWLLAVAVVAQPAEVPPSRESLVKKGKEATALVELKVRGTGSAFCVHSSGFFVTNEHVVRTAGKDGTVTLVLHPGLTNERVLQAKVLRADRELDLALVRTTEGSGFTALPLGTIEDVQELTDVIAFGFPFGKSLALDRKEYPAISVNTGQVTSLRRKGGELTRVQLDVALNPGNSGGPVVNARGQVVGIVVAGVPGARVNFAIPVSHLNRFLDTPALELRLPVLKRERLHEPVDFEARAVAVLTSAKPLDLELVLKSDASGERKLPMKLSDGVYRARAAALPTPTGSGPLSVTVRYTAGSLQGTVLDRPFRMGELKLKLSEVRSLDLRPKPRAVLHDGRFVEGALAELKELHVLLGEEELHVPLSKVVQVALQPPPRPTSVACTVIARRGEKEVGRLQESLLIPAPTQAGPGEPAAVAILPALLEKERVVRPLPAAVSDVAVGGGGRYLILLSRQSLLVFDVSQARIVKAIPVPDDRVKFAAGMDKLLVVHPASRTVQRWSLTTFQREQTAVLKEKGDITAVAMGAASAGPLLVGGISGPGDTYKALITFLDVNTLKPLPIKIKDRHGVGFGGATGVRASDDGRVFGMWGVGGSPQSIQTIVIEGDEASVRSEGSTPGAIVPGAGGKAVFTSRGGMYSPDVKQVEGSVKDGRGGTLPAHHPLYYLSVRALNGDVPEKERNGVAIHLLGESRPFAALPDVKEIEEVLDPWGRSVLTLDKRLHFVPDARLIVMLPKGEDRLILYYFDPEDALAKSDLDYLVVTSRPPAVAQKGEAFAYAIKAKSRKGGIRCQLVSGPEGMAVSPAGQVTWTVPVGTAAEEHSVVVGVSDASGREIFHTFALRVR
jgi:hypothetical protein